MNVNLWFAKNSKDDIVLITEINEQNRNEKYICPVCGSEVIPKAIGEDCVVSRHFAHSDKSKCSSESQIHFFFKHKLIEIGDKFKVLADKEYEFICKDIQVEQEHETEFGVYVPDMTAYTECGETIYFEMNYKNKKKIDDYIDKWIDLGKIVVEVDVKDMLDNDEISLLKALYYKNKVIKSEKTAKMSKINKYKTELLAKDGIDNPNTVKRLRGLTWFFNDLIKYNKDGDNVKLLMSLDYIKELNNDDYIFTIRELRNKHCSDLYFDYLKHLKRDFVCELRKELKEYGLQDIQLILDVKKGSNYKNDDVYINDINSERENLAKEIFKREKSELIQERKDYLFDKINISMDEILSDLNISIKTSDYTDYIVKELNEYKFKLYLTDEDFTWCVEIHDTMYNLYRELVNKLSDVKIKIIKDRIDLENIKSIYLQLIDKYKSEDIIKIENRYFNNKIIEIKINNKIVKSIYNGSNLDFSDIICDIENSDLFINRNNTFDKNYKAISDYLKEMYNEDCNYFAYDRIKTDSTQIYILNNGDISIQSQHGDCLIENSNTQQMLEDMKVALSEIIRIKSYKLCYDTICFVSDNPSINLKYIDDYDDKLYGVFSTTIIDEYGRKYQLKNTEELFNKNSAILNLDNILYYSCDDGIIYLNINSLNKNSKDKNIAFSFKKNLHSSKYLSEFDFVKATQLLEENYIKKNDMLGGIIWTDDMISQKVKTSKDKTFEILQDIMESVNKNTYGFILNEDFTKSEFDGRKQLWLIKDFCTAFEKSTGYKTINIK